MKEFALKPTSTYSVRHMEWTEATISKEILPDVCGVLEVKEQIGYKTKSTRYLVRRNPPSFYILIKSGGKERYNVDPAGHGICDCTGALQYGTCKHIECIRTLIREKCLN